MNLKVLKNKNLVLVILGQFVSGFGTYVQSFALSLYVLKKTGSAVLFSSVLAFSIIPYVLLSPVAGVMADRFSRKKMIVLMDILSSAVVAVFCAVFIINGELNMLSIYILVFLLSSISAFFTPSISAIMPDIVAKENLADANSARQVPNSLLPLISPVIGGVLFGVFGLLALMIINSISFFASAVSEMFIKVEKESLQVKKENDTYLASFRQGLSFIKKMPEIILMICAIVMANFALSPIFSVALPIVLLQDFKISEQLYGVFLSLSTVGMIIAPFFAAGIIKKHHYSRLVWSILAFDGILSVLIAVLSINGIFPYAVINYISMIIVMNILMATVIWINLSINTAMQLIVPGDILGRVSSVIATFALIASPLGIALMGALLEIGKSYLIMGAYAVLLAAVGFLAKIGFASLERKGKMDVTVGLDKKEEEGVPENA
jgi:MFS family permease